MPSVVAAFDSNTILVGLAAKLWAEKITRAAVAANLNMFITNPCLLAEGDRLDLQLWSKSGP